jgi:outer membrane lipoprotein-sorting protein
MFLPDYTNKCSYLYEGEYGNRAKIQNFFNKNTLWFYDKILNTSSRTHESNTQNPYNTSWKAHGTGAVDEVGRSYYYGSY